jgi:hypothetical protein
MLDRLFDELINLLIEALDLVIIFKMSASRFIPWNNPNRGISSRLEGLQYAFEPPLCSVATTACSSSPELPPIAGGMANQSNSLYGCGAMGPLQSLGQPTASICVVWRVCTALPSLRLEEGCFHEENYCLD